jgi:sugar phosphate isomerase/epimerase
MRFGIMAMQLDALLPSGLPADQAWNHLAAFDLSELARNLAREGFDPIELGADLGALLPHTYSPAAIERLADLKNELGIGYTVHLPLWSVEPAALLEPTRRGSMETLTQALQTVRPLGPEIYVLHATGALAAEFYHMHIPTLARDLLMRQFQNRARETIHAILSETGIPSRQLAIETVEFPFELTIELAEELNCSMCFDTGHVLVGFSGPIDFFDALERCLPRLGEIHLHDGPWQGPELKIGYGKDHQPLGEGDLDLGRLLDRLSDVNYQGPIIFELRRDDALASLDVIRSIRPNLVNRQ